MADSVEIQFVDESEYQNEGKWYFYIENSQLELCADVSGNIFPFPSKTKNNFRGIDISQPTPLMSLSVPLFSLDLLIVIENRYLTIRHVARKGYGSIAH